MVEIIGVDMPIYILLILAIVQGATEFLPISSSGHLVILYGLFGIDGGEMMLTILLHISTLVAILIYYRKELLVLLSHPLCPTNRRVVVSTICTALVYICMHSVIEKSFDGKYIFVCFTLTAMLLLISEYVTERKNILSRTNQVMLESLHCDTPDIKNLPISYTQAIAIGLTQGIAIFPGISRSGSTIAVGNMMGIKYAPMYSFIISIPTIIGSLILALSTGGMSTNTYTLGLILSMVVCSIVGVFCIRLVGRLNAKNKLSYFAYYLIALSTILVVLSFV